MLVTVTNRTSAELPVSASIGILAGGASRTVELNTAALEDARPMLVSLAAANLLTWSVAANTSAADDAAEGLMKEQVENGSLAASFASPLTLGAAKIFAGTGTPEAAVTAPVGCLFLRTNGGAGTTLYVKETGVGNTGWVAK